MPKTIFVLLRIREHCDCISIETAVGAVYTIEDAERYIREAPLYGEGLSRSFIEIPIYDNIDDMHPKPKPRVIPTEEELKPVT